ncbi:hypothetical protein [Proteus columbae]|nr:hypothetical protein [Proteus columbae]
MNSINEVGRKSLSIANKIIAVGGKIKLSISRVSIRVGNTINEFIHPDRYENKSISNTKSTLLKHKILIVSNEEQNNIDNEAKEHNLIENEKNILKERQQVLKDIELPNGDLIPIDEAINTIRLCKQDSLLKSKLSLIDHITDIHFKSPIKSNFDFLNELNNKSSLSNSKNEYDYVKFNGYENDMNDGYLIMTNLKNSDKNTINEVKSNANEIKSFSEKEDFKSYLTEITKDISLLDRLSDGDNSYGYVFLAKVANYLEDYNKNKEQEKTDCFNKENYLKKLDNSEYFFKLNKKVNNVIYLQYLKKEQSNHKNGVVEKITVTANNTLDEDSNGLGVDKPIDNGFSNAIRKVKSNEIKEHVINDIIELLEIKMGLDKEKIIEFKNELYLASKEIVFNGDKNSLNKSKASFSKSIVETILNSDEIIKSKFGSLDTYKFFLLDNINNAIDDVLYKN